MMTLLKSSNVTSLSDKYSAFTFHFIVIFHYKSRKKYHCSPPPPPLNRRLQDIAILRYKVKNSLLANNCIQELFQTKNSGSSLRNYYPRLKVEYCINDSVNLTKFNLMPGVEGCRLTYQYV